MIGFAPMFTIRANSSSKQVQNFEEKSVQSIGCYLRCVWSNCFTDTEKVYHKDNDNNLKCKLFDYFHYQ